MIKSLDTKLAEVKANSRARAFILADAKDADMVFGALAFDPECAGARAVTINYWHSPERIGAFHWVDESSIVCP